MSKQGLKNLTFTGHIESKMNKEKPSNISSSCNWMIEQEVGSVVKR